MNAPYNFILKNNGITGFYDVSYLNFNRKGDTSVLKQNIKSPFTKTLKKFAAKKLKNNFLGSIKEYNYIYNLHRGCMLKEKKQLKPLGLMSSAQEKKVRKAIECLVSMVKLSKDKTLKNKGKQYLTFVTLTLPSKQVHTDTEIRKLLTRYLENLQKTYDVEHYIWKAEPQTNGNIHFHIIVDRYVHWQTHRYLWNKQLDKLGYLDAYCKKHGNRNPNSTDVHKLQGVNSTTNYLLKYMTKPEKGKRPILGKIWGCANITKKLDYPRTSEGNPSFFAVNDLLRVKGLFKNVVAEDFFAHFVGDTYGIISKTAIGLWNEVKYHFQKLNGLVQRSQIKPKPFIRVKTYETIEEALKSHNERKKASKFERMRVKEEKKRLTTYDPYIANQFDIFCPL